MAKKKKLVKKSETSKLKDDSKLFAFLATFLSIIGFIIALILKKDDKYVMYYAKQSLVIFVVALIAGIVNMILAWVPIFGRIVSMAIGVAMLVLWVLSWVYALSGEEKEIPLISDYAKKINL